MKLIYCKLHFFGAFAKLQKVAITRVSEVAKTDIRRLCKVARSVSASSYTRMATRPSEWINSALVGRSSVNFYNGQF
jgi:hypothetical protein